jgi:predicted GIY-YIG superfamily endonuclease
MPDYSKLIIYKIEHNVDKKLVYVGSTTNLKNRKKSHKSNCYNESDKKYNLKLYKIMRENGGFEAFQILEVKKFPCNNKREAEAEEERCRVELGAIMNTQKAYTSYEYKLQYQKGLYYAKKIIT